MNEPRKAVFAFTKLIVEDVEKMAQFYGDVFGLKTQHRIEAEIAGEPISEIIMGAPPEKKSSESLQLVKYLKRTSQPSGGAIIGFVTTDLAALLVRLNEAGGKVVDEPRDAPKYGVRGALLADPEGHLVEVVQPLR